MTSFKRANNIFLRGNLISSIVLEKNNFNKLMNINPKENKNKNEAKDYNLKKDFLGKKRIDEKNEKKK